MLRFTENVTTLEPLTPKVSKARNTAHGDWRQPPEEDEALKWMEWMEDKRRGWGRFRGKKGLPNTTQAQPGDSMRKTGALSRCWSTYHQLKPRWS